MYARRHSPLCQPKIICGCIPTVGDKVRSASAIEPRYGKWTLPAGFMENRETTEEGAAREMWEEAEARAVDMSLYRIFDVPHISQVYVFYRWKCSMENLVPAQRASRVACILKTKFHGMSSRFQSSLRCCGSFLRIGRRKNSPSATVQLDINTVVQAETFLLRRF